MMESDGTVPDYLRCQMNIDMTTPKYQLLFPAPLFYIRAHRFPS